MSLLTGSLDLSAENPPFVKVLGRVLKCDGKDDGQVIQDAFDRLKARGGGLMELSDGEFHCITPPTYTPATSGDGNISIIGRIPSPVPPYGTRLTATLTGQPIMVIGVTGKDVRGITVRNILFDNNGNAGAGAGTAGLKVIRANTRCSFENLHFKGAGGSYAESGLELVDAIGCTLRDLAANVFGAGSKAFNIYTSVRNSGNLTLDNLEGIDSVNGTFIDLDDAGSQVLNNIVMLNCKAVKSSTTASSIGFHFKNIRNLVTLGLHSERYDTGIKIEGTGGYDHEHIIPLITQGGAFTMAKALDIATGSPHHITFRKLAMGLSTGTFTTGIDLSATAYDILFDTIFGNGTFTTLITNPTVAKFKGYYNAVPFANSGASSGTGAKQTIAHGAGGGIVTPTRYWLSPLAIAAVEASFDATPVDITNVFPYVTSGKAYRWFVDCL